VDGALHRGDGPKVSVVIPTSGRPELVLEAARSVLGQRVSELEVLVVLDGRDDRTAVALSKIGDPRLRIITLDPARGGNAARNAGVRGAAAPLVALLDDDDTWGPQHLDVLLRDAEPADRPWCRFARFEAVTAIGTEVWPRRLKPVDEAVADCRPRAADREVHLESDCDGGLAADVNAALIEQAVINLVDNAIKSSEPGRTVRISAASDAAVPGGVTSFASTRTDG
jgi:glycosyltransferase involved in cell wall biosynthesis